MTPFYVSMGGCIRNLTGTTDDALIIIVAVRWTLELDLLAVESVLSATIVGQCWTLTSRCQKFELIQLGKNKSPTAVINAGSTNYYWSALFVKGALNRFFYPRIEWMLVNMFWMFSHSFNYALKLLSSNKITEQKKNRFVFFLGICVLLLYYKREKTSFYSEGNYN